MEKRVLRVEPGRDILISRAPAKPRVAAPRREPAADKAGHLEQAIHHLHAAGLHDLADRLEIRARKAKPAPAVSLEPLQDLRSDIQRLRQEQQKLQAELRKLQSELRN
jgi:hypothetical protein